MSATKRPLRKPYSRDRHQRGAAAVEFALIAVALFMFVFAVIELARLMFLYNTLPEVTRRAASAAANADFTRSDDLDRVRWHALFRDSPGGLMLMDELTDQSIRIDYMAVQRNSDGSFNMVPIPTGSLPSSAAENRKVCLVNPNSSSCIRIVRVRVCKPGNLADCEPMQFQSLTSFVTLSVPLPIATTLAKAQSLGL
jgi:hypothetical protein